MYNFDEFLRKNNEKLKNIKYGYYRQQCEKILRKIFFKQLITDKEKDMLEMQTSITIDEWQNIINEHNQESRYVVIEESFLDANNMPMAI